MCIAFNILFSQTNNRSTQAVKIASVSGHLDNIPEVKWYYIEDNAIYIAFDPIYDGYQQTCNATAFKGNKAIGFGTHVYALDGKKYHSFKSLPSNWRFLYTATYRNGKKE